MDLTDRVRTRPWNAVMSAWVILITDGTVIEYPPEAYESAEQARNEARRWAWVLSGMGWLPIEESAHDRWVVGDRDVRLVQADGEGDWSGRSGPGMDTRIQKRRCSASEARLARG